MIALGNVYPEGLGRQIPGEGSCDHSVVIPPPNLLVRIRFVRQVDPLSHLLGVAATCSKSFAISFLKSSLACLGSVAAAEQANSLGNSQKK